MRLGVIGGNGWLGGAIVDALLATGRVAQRDISLSYRTTRPKRAPEAFWTTDNQALADRSDVIIVSVRPQDWAALNVDAAGKLVISVMAGIRLSAIAERLGTSRLVRSMPNAAAGVRLSYTPWVASTGVTEDDRETVRAIFDACGLQDEVGSERDIDYLTGLSGSGPAFPALLAAAMIDHAVGFGLDRDIATRAATTVLAGAGRLVERGKEAPQDLVDAFVVYRGVTAAAIQAMREAGFERVVGDGLDSANAKAIVLAND